jgi:Family of unknown function (DUF6174)
MGLHPRITAAALSGLLLSGTTGCAAAASDPPTTNRSWQEPNSYTYTLESSEGERALLGKFRITVRDRKVARAEGLDEYAKGIVARSPELMPTIGDLLRELGRLQRRNGDTAEIEYATDGHPRRITLDPDHNTIDDEATYVITEYEQLGR